MRGVNIALKWESNISIDASPAGGLSRFRTTALNSKNLSSEFAENGVRGIFHGVRARVRACARAGRFIKCSNKVHQCCNRKGQFSTACLTQCHLVSPESHWKCLSVSSLHLPLSIFHPVFRCLSVSLALCLFSLALPSADAASVPSHPFVLDSLASSVSLLVCVYLPASSLSLSLPFSSLPPFPRPQPRACRHQRHPQTGRPPWLFFFARLRETPDERRSVRVTARLSPSDASCEILKDVGGKDTFIRGYTYRDWTKLTEKY